MAANVLLALCAAWAGARLCGSLCARFGQPRVVGEIIAGVLLGPTGIGPEASGLVFNPDSVVPSLQAVAALGLSLYMFSVGLDFDIRLLRPVTGQVLLLSLLSAALPAAAAVGTAYYLMPAGASFMKEGATEGPFILALASAFTGSALPVAALILGELGIFDTDPGRICIGAAAVITVLQFVLLKLAEAAAVDPSPGPMGAAVGVSLGGTVGLAVGLAIGCRMWTAWRAGSGCVAKALRARLGVGERSTGAAGPSTCLAAYLVAVLSAVLTDKLGFTVVLGAFFAGCAVMAASLVIEKLAGAGE